MGRKGRKAAIYAAAGIPEHWVLDLADRRLVVHREPAGDRYEDIAVLTDTDEVAAALLGVGADVATSPTGAALCPRIAYREVVLIKRQESC